MRCVRTSLVVQWIEIQGRGFSPWPGKIPRATEQLCPCATTIEAAGPEPGLCNKRSHGIQLTAKKSSPCSLQMERALVHQQRLSAANK